MTGPQARRGQGPPAGRRRSGRPAGFQLTELLLSALLFGLVVGLCFYSAAAGFRIFTQTTGRQSLQRDARAIFAWLQRDVGVSNLVRCRSAARPVGGDRRDVLAVVGLDSWQPIPADSMGLPAWNRVIVYEATANSRGVMLRYLFEPASGTPVPLQANAVQDMLNGYLTVAGALDPLDQRRLSSSVRSFAVELSEARNTAVFNLVLSEETVQAGGGQSRTEVLEVRTTVFPRNTWPRL